MMKLCNHIRVVFAAFALATCIPALHAHQDDQSVAQAPLDTTRQRRVSNVIISGNSFTPETAISNYVTYRVGEVFQPQKARETILALYNNLGRFRNVTVQGVHVGNDEIEIHVIVQEKHPLKDVEFEGNTTIKEKDLREKINFDIPAIDEEQLQPFANQIKKLYLERGFSDTQVDAQLELDNEGRASIAFTIQEGSKSLIKQIKFVGNEHISSKKLRTVIYSREDWILGFLDQSGTYNPDRIQADKHMVEQFYQNNGFLQAKVTDLTIEPIEQSPNMNLIFDIEEGEQYTISDVSVSGNDELSENYLLTRIPIRSGQPYSRERIANTIKLLENIWGNMGYIFAHIEPSIQPDEDAKTVSLKFIADLRKKVTLNRINIKGNKKTRDKIIRRRILLDEGELLTKALMNTSRNNVEALGYFDQKDGVNWKLRRLTDESADLDLIVKEGRTGNFHFEVGFGGQSMSIRSGSGFTVKAGIADRNLFGSGINLNLDASWAREEQTLNFHLGQPWLFDKPISGAMDIYHKRPSYDNLRNINGAVYQRITGGALTAGVITNFKSSFFSGTQILGSLGFDAIRYERQPQASIMNATQSINDQFQCILNKEFAPGDFLWLAQSFEQDTRNHPIHTSRGHKWQLYTKFAIPSLNSNIGFYKVTLDAHWYTPVIDEYNLILHLHGFAGFAGPFGNNRTIPFGELFHMGGPKTVRGFLFGQIGPKFAGDSIGGTKSIFWNAELIFPITPDMTMKGVLFYDGGAGFDAPYTSCITDNNLLTGNNFDYRHSVGFGLRLLSPMPIAVDWGFKIDRRKDKFNPDNDESSHEVHFGMTYDW